MKRLKKVQYRRRREYKTDYLSRINLLRSGIPRLVVRKTNRYLLAQIVTSQIAQDKVIFTAHSKELLKYGWPKGDSIKNLAAGYLLGILCAAKAKKHGIKKAIVDLGLQRSTKGNRLYAVIKGAIDGGLSIASTDEIFPGKERIERGDLKRKVNVPEIKEKIVKSN